MPIGLGALAALAALSGAADARFDPARDGDTVMMCKLAYHGLERSAARLIDRDLRTAGVVQGFHGTRRIAPYADAVSRQLGDRPARDLEQGAGLVLGTLIGNAPMDAPETDPHVIEARTFAALAARCDVALAGWGAPETADLPPDVAATGAAEFQVNGKTAGETYDGATAALVRAACDGSAQGVARAVSNGAKLGLGSGKLSPLGWAIACENLAGIAAMLDAGADPNSPVAEDETAVTLAAGYRNTAILRLLLDRKGDPNAHTDRDTALGIAYSMGNFGAGWRAWDMLLAAGADINRAAPHGMTVVLDAAYHNDWDLVATLLERGYSGDLVELGRSATMSEHNIADDRRPALAKARRMLEARGVRFPVPALMDLQKDANGDFVQP
jgi:hypothetical protein